MSGEKNLYSQYFSQESGKEKESKHELIDMKYRIAIDELFDLLSTYNTIKSKVDVKNAFTALILDTVETSQEKGVRYSRNIYQWRDSVVLVTTPEKESNGFIILGGFIVAPLSTVEKTETFDDDNSRNSREENTGLSFHSIYVTIFNLGRETKMFPASVVGYDKILGFCILKLTDNQIPEDRGYLKWSDSKNLSPGSEVVIIGKGTKTESSIKFNYVSNARYADPDGIIKGDLISLSEINDDTIGSPIIAPGGIVGMILFPGVGIAEVSMRKSARGIIKCCVNGKVEPKYKDLIIKNADGIYESKTGSLGINGRKVVPFDLIGMKINVLCGYIVEKVLISNSEIEKGDLVTHIEGKALGDRIGQINPSIITLYENIGKEFEVTYRKKSELFSDAHTVTMKIVDVCSTI